MVQSRSRGEYPVLKPLVQMPINKDTGLALLEARSVVREEKDLVLSDTIQSALDEILMEHHRAGVFALLGLATLFGLGATLGL